MNRKKILIILGVLIGICLVIGGSYAAWILTVSQTGQNKILASCLNLTLTKEESDIINRPGPRVYKSVRFFNCIN